jgi:hypothetical protein
MNLPTKAHLGKCLFASLRLILYVVGISGTFACLRFGIDDKAMARLDARFPGAPLLIVAMVLAMVPLAAGALIAAVETRLKSPGLGYILLLLALLLVLLVGDPNVLNNEFVFLEYAFLLVFGSIGYVVTRGWLVRIKSRRAAQTARG